MGLGLRLRLRLLHPHGLDWRPIARCACLPIHPYTTFPGNGSNDFLEIWHEVGNIEMLKSVRNRFLKKIHPPSFWAQKAQIWAKIELFRNLDKNGSNDFLLWILSTKMDTKKLLGHGAL